MGNSDMDTIGNSKHLIQSLQRSQSDMEIQTPRCD